MPVPTYKSDNTTGGTGWDQNSFKGSGFWLHYGKEFAEFAPSEDGSIPGIDVIFINHQLSLPKAVKDAVEFHLYLVK